MFSALGVDYGTNSVRALIVDCATGAELGSAVVDYPSGHQGVLLDKSDHHLARQNPADYLFGLEKSVLGALQQAAGKAGFSPGQVIGIGVDTTGSSPLPVDATNTPLALDPKWSTNLAAQCWLWKDHTSHQRGGRHHPHRGAASSPIYREVRQYLFVGMVLVEDLALPQGRAGRFRCRL